MPEFTEGWPAELPTEHSPVDGSNAYRFIACSGSVNMSTGIEDEESEYAAIGTAAHVLAGTCLEEDKDAWEYVGRGVIDGKEIGTLSSKTHFKGRSFVPAVLIDSDMARAVQVYLDAVNAAEKQRVGGRFTWIEFPFHAKAIHPMMYGRVGAVMFDEADCHLHVWDYRHGIGVVVGPQYNTQTLYYAIGVLEQMELWSKVSTVTTYLAQPRGFHPDGPIRNFTYSIKEVARWLGDVLLPALALTEVSHDTTAGEHCRFCPARSHACPALMENSKELARMTALIEEKKGGAARLSPEQIGQILTTFSIAKIQESAVRSLALARLNEDKPIPGWKLVGARVSRAWKEGAYGSAFDEFGTLAFKEDIEEIAQHLFKAAGRKVVRSMLNENTIKSPEQFVKLPGGKKFCSRWTFKPPVPRTLVPVDDPRRIVARNIKAIFKAIEKK